MTDSGIIDLHSILKTKHAQKVHHKSLGLEICSFLYRIDTGFKHGLEENRHRWLA